jgi:hypothetical protein
LLRDFIKSRVSVALHAVEQALVLVAVAKRRFSKPGQKAQFENGPDVGVRASKRREIENPAIGLPQYGDIGAVD